MHLKPLAAKNLNSRRAGMLPIIGPIVRDIPVMSDSIVSGLAYPNSPLARVRLGEENILHRDDDLIICSNGYFTRYLQISLNQSAANQRNFSHFSWPKDMAWGSLILKGTPEHPHMIDMIYVLDEVRRQGIATGLVERALQDFSDLCLEGGFSEAGLAFFGVNSRRK